MKVYSILLVFVFFLAGKSCSSESSSTDTSNNNAVVQKQNDGAVNKRNPAHEKEVMQQFAEGNTKKTGEVWTNDDVQVFMEECVVKIKKNPSLDPNQYCSCLMGIMRDQYGTQEYSRVVKENGQQVAKCLMAAKK